MEINQLPFAIIYAEAPAKAIIGGSRIFQTHLVGTFYLFYFAWNSYGYEPTEIWKLHNLTT